MEVKNLRLISGDSVKSFLIILVSVCFICIGFCCPMLCSVLRWLTATGRLSVKLSCCLFCRTVFIRLRWIGRIDDLGI